MDDYYIYYLYLTTTLLLIERTTHYGYIKVHTN